MEKIFALIKNGKVFNTIAATQSVIDEMGLEKLSADAAIDITGSQFGIGHEYDGVKFTKPLPPEPTIHTPTLEEKLAALTAEIEVLKQAKGV